MKILINADELQALRESETPMRILDCRATLGEPAAGREAWLAGHIPSSMHADLETELSMAGPATQGRHPLPDDAQWSATLSRWGVSSDTWLIAYDAGDGAYAARAWWLATRAEHSRTLVLDGGIAAWSAAGYERESGEAQLNVEPIERAVMIDRSAVVDADALTTLLETSAAMLLDARAAPRFRGEIEPIDAIAGHIPGAHNRPYMSNLEGGRFKSADVLRAEFDSLLQGADPACVVHMCGSGVTACHNLLAMDIAGLAGSRLFAPSWSGWIADADRAIAFGGDSPVTPAL